MRHTPSRREFALSLLHAAALSACGSRDDTGGDWASGGTAAMSGVYPDPFAGEPGACVPEPAGFPGPCYAGTLERSDISEGISGLPVRLAFRVVDAGCEPVEGAVVDVWHCAPSGLYSGEDAAPACTQDDAARAGRWFRGTQTTRTDGKVRFDTCFPGWYASRAVHIHFQIRIGGQEVVTSHLLFEQDLLDEIFSSHLEYAGYGLPDTPNAADAILGAQSAEAHLAETRRMSDGVLLAWKTVILG